jgi:hypothetical protein
MKATIAALILAAGLTAGCHHNHHEADEDEMKISQANTPPAVLASFEKAYPDATIKEVEKENYPNGDVHYEIVYTDSKTGKTHEIELDSTGKILEDH